VLPAVDAPDRLRELSDLTLEVRENTVVAFGAQRVELVLEEPFRSSLLPSP
jgi:hypothetical protein